MSETRPLRAGVIGVGYLGGFHASKYAALDGVELRSVYDSNPSRAAQVAGDNRCRSAASCEELLAEVDLVSIAVPTQAHLEVGLAAMDAGVHVLIEKPLAADSREGRILAAKAEESGLVVQVGHLERFNPVFEDMRSVVSSPRFIECHRLSPFAGRGGDTSVVYDVMIHDLDIVAFLVGEELAGVEAVGVPVLSAYEDIANARLRFEGGCVANVTASRVSLKRERKLRLFQPDAYVSIDFDERKVTVARRKIGAGAFDPALPMAAIEVEERSFDTADPLLDEVRDFVACVRESRPPKVGIADGLIALALADRVFEALADGRG